MAVRLKDVAEAGQVVCTGATHQLLQAHFECAVSAAASSRAWPTSSCSAFRPSPVRNPIEMRGRRRTHAADGPRPRDQPAQGPLGAGPGGHGPGRPAHRRAGPGQVAPGLHAEGARPGADGRRGGGRARHRVLLAALSRTRGCTRPSNSTSGPSPSAARSRRRPGSTGCSVAWRRMTWPDRRPCRCGRRCCRCRPRTVSPLSLSPARQREETFRAMLEWLHTRAARKPILFVVEDLHWVDASTLEFLGQFLAEACTTRSSPCSPSAPSSRRPGLRSPTRPAWP